MAVTPMGRLPFQYATRWMYIEDLSVPMRQRLEERDRQLEDFLGAFGGGVATAIRRTSGESHDTSTGYNINFNVTDYENGAHASGGTIVIDRPGVWHCTTSWHYNFIAAGGSGNVQLVAGSQGIATDAGSQVDGFGNTIGFCNISGDFLLAPGDVVRSGPYWTGGEVGGVISVSGCFTDLRLSAHLVG